MTILKITDGESGTAPTSGRRDSASPTMSWVPSTGRPVECNYVVGNGFKKVWICGIRKHFGEISLLGLAIRTPLVRYAAPVTESVLPQ